MGLSLPVASVQIMVFSYTAKVNAKVRVVNIYTV